MNRAAISEIRRTRVICQRPGPIVKSRTSLRAMPVIMPTAVSKILLGLASRENPSEVMVTVRANSGLWWPRTKEAKANDAVAAMTI
jgi:hypothetical protein